MDPSYLDREDFIYKCHIRNIDPKDPQALPTLCDRLDKEAANLAPQVTKVVNSINSEIADVRSQVESLLQNLKNPEILSDSENLLRVQARLWHFLHRIIRVQAAKPNIRAADTIAEMIEKGLEHVRTLLSTDSDQGAVGGELNPRRNPLVPGSTPKTSIENLSIMGGQEKMADPVVPTSANQLDKNSDKTHDNLHASKKSSPPQAFSLPLSQHPSGPTGPSSNTGYAISQTVPHFPVHGFSHNMHNISLPQLSQIDAPRAAPLVTSRGQNIHRDATQAPAPSVNVPPHRQEHGSTNPSSSHNNYPRSNQNASFGRVPQHSYHPRRGYRSTSPLKRWNLTFSGSRLGLPVEEFLFRLESLSAADHITDNVLAAHIHRFLSDKALNWYWLYRRSRPNATWSELCQAMLDEFRSQTTDFEIRQAMCSRHQRPNEPFGDFRMDIQSMAARLRVPMCQEELIEIVKRNMNPRLRNALLLYPVTSLEELRDLAKKFEKLWSETDLRAKPRNVSEIYPSVDYSPFDFANQPNFTFNEPLCDLNSQISPSFFEASETSNTVPPMVHTDEVKPHICAINHTSTDKYICWNCDVLGHSFRECPTPQRNLFCYKCGRKNVTTPLCSQCTSGNGSSNGTNSKTSRLARRSPETKKPPVQTLKKTQP